MKRIYFLSFFFFTYAATRCTAQTVTPVVLNSSGIAGIAGSIQFEFNLGENFTTTIGTETVVTQGLLQPLLLPANGPLPVTGLEFQAKRLNGTLVQLDWKTMQETDNKGFFIERKKENQNSFVAIAFENSKAVNGNSTLPLNYSRNDSNAYSGRTYYRLRQEDKDGKFAYSLVRMLSGEAGKAATIKAWPVPAVKEFSVSMSGVAKDQLLIYDVAGRLVKRQPISENEVIKITGLLPGHYVLALQAQKDLHQQIILQ